MNEKTDRLPVENLPDRALSLLVQTTRVLTSQIWRGWKLIVLATTTNVDPDDWTSYFVDRSGGLNFVEWILRIDDDELFRASKEAGGCNHWNILQGLKRVYFP